MEKEEKIGKALLKVALGYQVAEVTEEYAEVDGALKLTKRKRTKKDVPPDLKAVQILLDSRETGRLVEGLSDEELEAEKSRLLALLAAEEEKEKEKGEEQVCVEVKKEGTGAKRKPRAKARKRVVRKKKTEV